MVNIPFFISHVPPAHSFFKKKSILKNLCRICGNLFFAAYYMRIYNENLFFHKFVVHKFVEFLYFSGKFAGVELNAAYLFASEALGNTMTFGLGYSF